MLKRGFQTFPVLEQARKQKSKDGQYQGTDRDTQLTVLVEDESGKQDPILAYIKALTKLTLT